MNLTFTVYHTCHLKGSLNDIFSNSPYKCDPNTQQWLGDGYYFWTDSEYFAHKWGMIKSKYPNGYVITKYLVDIPEESFLDLVGNVRDQIFFAKQILEYAKRMGYELDNSEDARKIALSKVLDHLRKYSQNNNFPIKYDAIRAFDYQSVHTKLYKYTEDSKEQIPIPTRQQLFLKDFSFLKRKELFCANKLNGRNYHTVNSTKIYTYEY